MEKLLRGVEIFSAGQQTDSSGMTETFTVDDLDVMVDRFNTGDPEFVPVKLGHTSDEFNRLVASQLKVPQEALHGENGGQDGVISLGRVVSLRRVQDKLVADFQVPEPMAQMVQDGYLRDVSVEMRGGSGDWTLTGVAWLGAELPAVKNLNGLAAAAVLRQQVAGPVLAFKRSVVIPEGERGADMGLLEALRAKFNRPDMTDEEAADIIASKYAEGDDEEEKPDFPPSEESEDEEEEESEMEDGAEPSVTPIEGEVAAAVKAILGLEMTADGEAILSALRNAVGLPEAAPAEEVVPMMKRKLAEKPVAFKETAEYKSLTAEIATLKRKDRLNHYRAETSGLLIQGKDEDLAEKLVSIEEKAGPETAEELLASWKRESDATKQFTQATGRAKVEDTNAYDFEARAKAKAEKEGVDYAIAFSRLSLEDPKAFNAYRSEKAQNAV